MSNFDPPADSVEKINFDQFLKIERQREEINRLLIENSQLKSKKKSSGQDIQELDHLQKQNKMLKEENQKLQQKIQTLQTNQRVDQKEKQVEHVTKEPDHDEDESETLAEAQETIENQLQTIERLEDELVELDRKYDTYIIKLKKKITSLEEDIEKLEQKNTKLSSSNFSHLRSEQPRTDEESASALIDKMKHILKSWPGGIKLRNLAMSMGISVAATNEFLEVLQEENVVRIDEEHAVNSNPVIYPI